jgi:anti-sigma-K factor RskA
VTGRVLQLDPAAHKVADVLLPWFVNGTLDGDERAFVERHLEQCVRCQREVAWLRELHLACVTAEADPGASNAARKLRRRLEEPRAGDNAMDNAMAALQRLWRRVRPWSQWIAATELVLILALGAWLLLPGDTSTLYRTLGARDAHASASGNLVVVFDPATTEAELRRMLRDSGARIVDGPTQSNAYVLDVPAPRQERALKALRAERAAVLVEPLGPGSPR